MSLLFLIDHRNDGNDHEKTYAYKKPGRLDFSNSVPDTAAAIRIMLNKFAFSPFLQDQSAFCWRTG